MRNSPYGITVPFRTNATINKFPILRIAPAGPHHGRPPSLLLPEFPLPRLPQAGGQTPYRDQPLRTRQGPTDAPLPYLQGPLLRTEGDTPVRLPTAAREGRIGPGARRRGVR